MGWLSRRKRKIFLGKDWDFRNKVDGYKGYKEIYLDLVVYKEKIRKKSNEV